MKKSSSSYIRILLVVSLSVFSSVSYAANYLCTIKSINFDDRVDASVRKIFIDGYVNKVFVVTSRDGVMRGVLSNAKFKSPTILHPGDDENSLVVATIVSPITDAGAVSADLRILTIKGWEPEAEKTFSLFWDDKLFRGICEITKK